MRRDAREAVYKILFSELFNDENSEDFDNFMFSEQNLKGEDVSFAKQLLNKIRDNKEEINQIISTFAKGYNFDRIYSTDKCALTLAICEMKYFSDIPNVVSIDEALYLVRKYSTEESLNFVNGILAGYIKSLEV